MSTIFIKGKSVPLLGTFPKVGMAAPHFTLRNTDLKEMSLQDFSGKKKLIYTVPSLDTSVCLSSTHIFSNKVKGKQGLVFLLISADLPFAHKRICTGEKLDNVITLSTLGHPEFGKDFGVGIAAGALTGLCARAVLVLDETNRVIYAELVPELTQEPKYDILI